MINHAVKMLTVLSALLVIGQPASAGEIQKQIINKTLAGAGMDEAARGQVAEVADIALEAVREYARGFPPATGNLRSSTPNPVAPLVTIAANLNTIACASTLVSIRIAQRDLVFKLTREYRDATKQEADLIRKLDALHSAMYRACNPDDKTEKTPPPINTTGSTALIPSLPDGWTQADVGCLRSCSLPYINYTRRAERGLRSTQKAIKQAANKYTRIVKSQVARYNDGLESCQSFAAPITKQFNKLSENYDLAGENVAALDRYYQKVVVACMKQCSVRVQITLNREYPEIPEHVNLRMGLLTWKSLVAAGMYKSACGSSDLNTIKPLKLNAPIFAPPEPLKLPSSVSE